MNPPVVMSSTFHQGGELTYGRDGNPTWSALEEALGGLEGGSALVFASGMAAVAAVLETLPVPGRVVVAGDAYNGVRRFLGDAAGRGRVVFRAVDVSNTEATLAACAELVEVGPHRGPPDGPDQPDTPAATRGAEVRRGAPAGAGEMAPGKTHGASGLRVAGGGTVGGATVGGPDGRPPGPDGGPPGEAPGKVPGGRGGEAPAGVRGEAPGGAPALGGRGLLWLESPTNPLLAVADLEALIAGAHQLGMDVAVDNTFATPLLQRPLDFGADVVVHSATKLLSGHSDVVLGAAVSTRADVIEAVDDRRSLHGAIAGPWEAWLVLRGIRTLSVRLDRAQANAAELAARLGRHPAVEVVRYPGLLDHPQHRLAARQMRAFGTMIAFDVTGGAAAAEAVAGAVRLATAGTSLGGVETLIERRGRWSGEHALPPGLLRLSVGIEDVEDLWRDLEAALRSISG